MDSKLLSRHCFFSERFSNVQFSLRRCYRIANDEWADITRLCQHRFAERFGGGRASGLGVGEKKVRESPATHGLLVDLAPSGLAVPEPIMGSTKMP